MKPPLASRSKVIIVASFLLLTVAAVVIKVFISKTPTSKPLLYQGKSIEAWFYGSRTNFFREDTTKAAQKAFDSLGTNAFPFLLGNLKDNRGDGTLYFKAFHALPSWVQVRLYYPILSDDIRAFTWNYLRKMPRLAREQINELVDCVPSLVNPRVRMSGFNFMRSHYETDPAFSNLCRELLDDADSGIRLEGAISLAESSIVSDPREPRLFPILIDGLQSKETRKGCLDISGYRFQQIPPGGTGNVMGIYPGLPDQDQYLRTRIETALYRLKAHLPQDQKDRFTKALLKSKPTDETSGSK